MLLNANILDTWQRCRRRAAIAQSWHPIRWRPRELFTASLRKAIFTVSNGMELYKAVEDAKALFLQVAANPGLDVPVGVKPYQIAKDWCAMLDTTVRAIARLTLLGLHEAVPVNLTKDIVWQPLAWADDSGQLHRWIVTDSWTEGDFYRELHGWHTFGDIAMLGCPMMLHVVEIGQQRNGRRASSWVRAFQHPGLSSLKLHFKKKDGAALIGWKPVFITDTAMTPDEWVDTMAREGECERLIKHLVVNVPSEEVCADTRRQILNESMEMVRLNKTKILDLPMSRGACDTYTPCPFQPVCYTEKLVDIATLGFYKRTASTSTEDSACLQL